MRDHRLAVIFAAVSLCLSATASGHDIPNVRVDRSIQATIQPGRFRVDYEVSLSELTLTQDLKSLIGGLEGGDRQAWFDTYGRETGPLNAKGMLVTVDGQPIDLAAEGFDLAVEEHPRYTFHFRAAIPDHGRLFLHDTNFAASEGTSRLAIRGRDGVVVRGDELPGNVDEIRIRPTWQLTDEEEARTKRVAVEYSRAGVSPTESSTASATPSPTEARSSRTPDRLSRLLDRSAGLSLAALCLISLGLGAAHAIQPGHGKTLVAATVVGEGGRWIHGTVLGIVTTLTHTGSVILVALALWWTASTRFAEIHVGLMRAAGFLIAAVGAWRLGRHLAGLSEHDELGSVDARHGFKNLLGLGVAGGLVPCWDAVGLILLSEAVGRFALGIALLVAFGVGMAIVLITVGWLAASFRGLAERRGLGAGWERGLGIASSLVLGAIGGYLLLAT